MKKLSIHCCR